MQLEAILARKRSPSALVLAPVPDALGSALALRERMLLAAGIDEPEQARIARLAVDKFTSLLDAKRKQRLVVNAGLHNSEVREFIDEDHVVQARAAAELAALIGLYPSKSAGSINTSGPTQINVHLVTRPREAQVIDIIDSTRKGTL